jgi:hypothetical protein
MRAAAALHMQHHIWQACVGYAAAEASLYNHLSLVFIALVLAN